MSGKKGYVHSREYRPVYIAHYGLGPYTCAICKELMDDLEVCHHIDEDRENNHISNLEAHHTICHNRHHHTGLKHSQETKAHLSEVQKKLASEMSEEERKQKYGRGDLWLGRKHSVETKEKMSQARAGRPMSKAARAKQIGRKASDETKAKMSASHKGVTQSPETNAKRSASLKAMWARKRAERESG